MSGNTNNNNAHMAAYKNNSKNSQEIRLRHQENLIELRKNKKEEEISKRRNIEIQELPSDTQTSTISIDDLKVNLESNDPELKLQTIQTVCNMLSKEKNSSIDTVIVMGLVPIFIKLLDDFENPNIQFEATYALSKIALGTTDQRKIIISQGAVPKFVALLKSKDPKVVQKAICALGNIASKGAELRDIVLQHNIVDHMIDLVMIQSNCNISFLRKIAILIYYLCRQFNPAIPFDKVKQLLPLIIFLLDFKDPLIQSPICMALYFATDDEDDIVDSDDKGVNIAKSECVLQLIELLTSDKSAILVPALGALRNLESGNLIGFAFQKRMLEYLGPLMLHANPRVVQQAVSTFHSMITSFKHDHIEAVLDSRVLNYLAEVLKGRNDEAQGEAAEALIWFFKRCNSYQLYRLIVNFSIIKPYCDLLSSNYVMTILDGLEVMFRKRKILKLFVVLKQKIPVFDQLMVLSRRGNQRVNRRVKIKAFDLLVNSFPTLKAKRQQLFLNVFK